MIEQCLMLLIGLPQLLQSGLEWATQETAAASDITAASWDTGGLWEPSGDPVRVQDRRWR